MSTGREIRLIEEAEGGWSAIDEELNAFTPPPVRIVRDTEDVFCAQLSVDFSKANAHVRDAEPLAQHS